MQRVYGHVPRVSRPGSPCPAPTFQQLMLQPTLRVRAARLWAGPQSPGPRATAPSLLLRCPTTSNHRFSLSSAISAPAASPTFSALLPSQASCSLLALLLGVPALPTLAGCRIWGADTRDGVGGMTRLQRLRGRD